MPIIHQTTYLALHHDPAGATLETEWLDFANSEQLRTSLHEALRNPGTPAPEKTQSSKPKTQNFPLTHLASTDWHEWLLLRRHATTVFDFDEQEKLGELNRKLHYALRRLVSAPDLPRVLRQLAAEGFINAQERPALEAGLTRLLADPRLAPYFAPGLAVETEREILLGGHTLRTYKPDRIVFGTGPSRATQTVTLLDFKLPPPQDIHKIRLREYARLFRELGYGDVRGVIYYFGTGEVVEV